MHDYTKMERLLAVLSSSARLEILDCIGKGFANPGEIAKKLDMHRSSVEKHIRVLVSGRLIEKVPSMNKKGQLTVKYRLIHDMNPFLSQIEAASAWLD